MKRDWLIRLLVLLGIGLGGWWLTAQTEWVETERERPAQGEARDNPVFAFELLMRELGLRASHHETLDVLPPPGARLVLLSGDWALNPTLPTRLERWVQQGGHLVLTLDANWQASNLLRWVPVETTEAHRAQAKRPAEPVEPETTPDLGSPEKAKAFLKAIKDRREQLHTAPPLWRSEAELTVCGRTVQLFKSLRVKPGPSSQPPEWTLTHELRKTAKDQDDGTSQWSTPALRVRLGQGSVTALEASNALFMNGEALRCDHPLLLAAAVQAEAGATVWVYLHEKREALLPWLWQQAWIAIVIGLLALSLWLWRAAVRFGPLQPSAPRLRRSVAEQVHGLAAYLRRGSPEALLAAEQRALNDLATRRLHGFARLAMGERARAIAAATDLPAHDLAVALTEHYCTRARLPGQLLLLETARRRLQRTLRKDPAP